MATVYSAPANCPPPDFDDYFVDGNYNRELHDKLEREYIDRLAQEARQQLANPDPIVGEEIRFQRGDGYARYVVWNAKPLQLIWLELGDAWSVEDALIRGLRLTDVREMVQREQRIRELFAQRRKEREESA